MMKYKSIIMAFLHTWSV